MAGIGCLHETRIQPSNHLNVHASPCHTHLGEGIPAIECLVLSVHFVHGAQLVPHHPIAQCLLQGLGECAQEVGNGGNQLWVSDGQGIIVGTGKLDVTLRVWGGEG